jgi:hypothetical protein
MPRLFPRGPLYKDVLFRDLDLQLYSQKIRVKQDLDTERNQCWARLPSGTLNATAINIQQ